MHIDPLMTREEAAAFLRIDPRTLDRHVREGKIPALRIGKLYRFRKEEVEAAITPKVHTKYR